MSKRKSVRSGMTLIELMIVISMITIIAAVAIPKMLSARLTANETAAIAVLKAILTAQSQTQTRGVIDTDGDGAGEFGYLGELTGTVPARVSVVGAPGAGALGVDELKPSALLTALGDVTGGVSEHAGYYFQVFLPSAAGGGGVVTGIAEDGTGGKLAAPFPDPNMGEVLFCAYAWPRELDRTGQMVYFMSQEGLLLRYFNRGATTYFGLGNPPPFDAVFSVANDMSSPLGLNGLAIDGNLWVPVQ